MAPDANSACLELEKCTQAHLQYHLKSVCTVNIALDKELCEGDFTSMSDGVRPVDVVPLRDAHNRTGMHFLATQHLAVEHGGIEKQLVWEYLVGDDKGEV